jgi:DNA-binding ferritin-like protein
VSEPLTLEYEDGTEDVRAELARVKAQRDRLLEELKEGVRLCDTLVDMGVTGCMRRQVHEIKQNHVLLKSMREAIAEATDG